MRTLQELWGMAALVAAATNILALVMFITLAPKGYGADDPGQAVLFLVNHQVLVRALYQIQYLVFGVSLIFLSLALYERLQAAAPVLAHAVAAFGLIWAFLVIVVGRHMHSADPDRGLSCHQLPNRPCL